LVLESCRTKAVARPDTSNATVGTISRSADIAVEGCKLKGHVDKKAFGPREDPVDVRRGC